ncbi:TPA: Hsp33 family molecular chaperone HslO [Streptococcus suis]
MKNKITKYLAENRQIRIYILSGIQIYKDTEALEMNSKHKTLFREALNITALANALNSGQQRLSYTFFSKNRKSKISTESFSNGTITGMVTTDENQLDFRDGTLQTISTSDNKFGSSHTSHSSLNHGNIYMDIEQYYFSSEQTPTYLFPLSKKKNIVLLMQPLPFADEKIVNKVLSQLNSLKSTLSNVNTKILVEILSSELNDWKYLDSVYVEYSCSCSKDMFLGIVFSLSKEEINDILSKKENLEVTCSLCNKKYVFSTDEIMNYLQ